MNNMRGSSIKLKNDLKVAKQKIKNLEYKLSMVKDGYKDAFYEGWQECENMPSGKFGVSAADSRWIFSNAKSNADKL